MMARATPQSTTTTNTNTNDEEAALTALLFGGGSATSSSHSWENKGKQNEGSSLLFTIDRIGAIEEPVEIDSEGGDQRQYREDDDVDDDEDDDVDDDENSANVRIISSSTVVESEEEELEHQGEANSSIKGAAWKDDDDDDTDDTDERRHNGKKKKSPLISLHNGPSHLKKLRKSLSETQPISIKDYELRLRNRFLTTASSAARTDWAQIKSDAKSQYDEDNQATGSTMSLENKSDDEEQHHSLFSPAAKRILQSNASLFSNASLKLPPTILQVIRTKDGNMAEPNQSCIYGLQFHPTAGTNYGNYNNHNDPDPPLLMTAGMDKMLRFFRIDEEENNKVHGIHFSKLPIMCASFLGNSGNVVLSGRRPYFYVYDAVSGNVDCITTAMLGRQERHLEKFAVSPDGRLIAFMGDDGYIILVDAKSRQWIGDLKMNGNVRAIVFSPEGESILGSGSDGDVYRWNLRSQRCVERFHNEDGTVTVSLAKSHSNVLAVGAVSGVVNLYNHDDKLLPSTSILSSIITQRTPIKSVMNLTTSADILKFNGDSQILAISTRREKNALKLLHVPTATVFSNWPTANTPLGYVWSMDFSPRSKYFAVGNDHGKCLLYRLKHYWNE